MDAKSIWSFFFQKSINFQYSMALYYFFCYPGKKSMYGLCPFFCTLAEQNEDQAQIRSTMCLKGIEAWFMKKRSSPFLELAQSAIFMDRIGGQIERRKGRFSWHPTEHYASDGDNFILLATALLWRKKNKDPSYIHWKLMENHKRIFCGQKNAKYPYDVPTKKGICKKKKY